VAVDELVEGGFELLLAAEDDVRFLQVGGERQAVQLRTAGQRAPDIPGVDRAADGAVDQMQGVGDGIEHHARAAEDAGALADGPGQGVAVAGDVYGALARPVDLILSLFQYAGLHVFLCCWTLY
jgi:hypothetical protein